MSISIEQVLADAKRLVERLRSHDTAADSLIQQTSGLNKRIETMTELQEDIEEMNNIARHRPRTALILGIQRENRQIRQLQEENAELVASLKQHQAALDLIMSSYREQITRIQASQKSEKSLVEKHSKETHETAEYIQKIIEMAAVMQRAADCDETYCFQMEEMIAKLEYENKGLRELLRITKSVAKATVVPLSPLMPKGGHEKVEEDTVRVKGETFVVNSLSKAGAASRVEICEDNLGEDSVVENCISQERVGIEEASRVLVQLSKEGLTNSGRADSGGGGRPKKGATTAAPASVGNIGVTRTQEKTTNSGAISKSRNINKNNNTETDVDSGMRTDYSGDTGPSHKQIVADGDGVLRLNALTNHCNDETDIQAKKGNRSHVAMETECSSEDYDTSSLSSQSSMSTVKEADSISITSEFSDAGGDVVHERLIVPELVGVDSTHL